jgi:hypothetical protein
MKEIPTFTLWDMIFGSLITRWVPLSQSGCDSVLALINNTSDFQSLIPYFVGLNSENSNTFIQSFNRVNAVPDNKFQNIVNAIPAPKTLYMEFLYVMIDNKYLFSAATIQMLFDVLQMTPEFRPFLEQLEGITPENSNMYNKVFDQLVQLPMFLINSQKFLLNEE